MKTVVQPRQVAHLWAHAAQSSARNSTGNIFFEQDTIYSYGHHFPMARRVVVKGGTVAYLMTTRGYSSTTAKHLSFTRQALHGLDHVFHVHNPTGTPSDCLASYAVRIEFARTEFFKTKVKGDDAYATLAELIAERNEFYSLFRCGRAKPLAIPQDVEDLRAEKATKQAAFDAKRADRREARNAEANAERQRQLDILGANGVREAVIAAWRRGDDVRNVARGLGVAEGWLYMVNDMVGGTDGVLLRMKPGTTDTIETSLGAEFPEAHGRRAWRFLAGLVATGTPWQRNGHSVHVGGFQVDSMDSAGTIKAGCHVLQWSEVQGFAEAQGWK